jgi:cytochrome c oxidase subunit 3
VTAGSEVMVAPRGEMTAVHHEQRGIDTALLGMILFICSEVMFFAGLFAVYFSVRASHRTWPPEGFDIEVLPLAAMATTILLISSLSMQWAVWRIRRGDRTGMNRALVVTIILGVTFLCIQLYDYTTLGFGLNSEIYGSMFYTMTGFHGAHVFGGVLGLSLTLMRGVAGQFSARHHVAVEAISIYWHFVDVVWIALFSTLYLVR